VSPILLLLLAAASCASAQVQSPGKAPAADRGAAAAPGVTAGSDAAAAPGVAAGDAGSRFLVERGDGLDPIEIPRDEELVFGVEIDVGILGDLDVGTVTLRSGVEPYRAGLPPSTAASAKPEPPRSVGFIQGRARGSYLGYELRHEMDVRHLPQTWPRILLRDTQAGSENRRKELRLGILEGKETAVFRNDGHCRGCTNQEHFIESAWVWGEPYHCKKCKRAEHRVWGEPKTRAIPSGTVDLLTSVYLARGMVRRNVEQMTFPAINKLKLWTLTLRRGTRKVVETPAGKFECVYVQLETAIPPGEPKDEERFQGLFGIQGSIRIWMEASTGVPVTISGELPVPVIDTLDLNIRLESYRGTPPQFRPRP